MVKESDVSTDAIACVGRESMRKLVTHKQTYMLNNLSVPDTVSPSFKFSLPEDEFTELRIVDEAIDADLIGHVDHLLLARIEAQSLHRVQSVLNICSQKHL